MASREPSGITRRDPLPQHGVSVHVIHQASRWVEISGLRGRKIRVQGQKPLADKTSVLDDAIKSDMLAIALCRLIHTKYISCRKVELVCIIYHFSHTTYPNLHR